MGSTPGGKWQRLSGVHRSVRTRLILWNVLTITLIVTLFGAAAEQTMRRSILSSLDRELMKRSQGLAENPDPTPHHPQPEPTGHHAASPDPARPYSGFDRPQVLDQEGRVRLPQNMPNAWDKQAALRAAAGHPVLSTVTVAGYPFRVASCPYPLQGPYAGVVQVPYPLTEAYHSLDALNRAMLNLAPAALLLAACGAAFMASRALRPVRDIARTAEQIGSQNLTTRLTPNSRDEFEELSNVINRMLDRVQGLVEREREFTADASHELQTPLAVIKANASLCLTRDTDAAGYRRSMEAIDRASSSMAALTQDLLLLARADAGHMAENMVELPVADILADARALVPAVQGPEIEITVDEGALCVMGCEQELVRVFVNLFQNALRSTPAQGQICVHAWRTGSQARITVRDTGTGIAPEHLAHLGERFYRADKARSRAEGGTGLGLAIVKTILTAHRGTLQFESQLGQGTTVTVTLPAANGSLPDAADAPA